MLGQGRESLRLQALILRGDWCDSDHEDDTATNENSDAGRGGTASGEEKSSERIRKFRTTGNVRPLDRRLLMGDP